MMTWISGKMTLISEMETPTPLFQQTRVEKLYYFSTNFLKTLHTWSSPPNATSDDRFFQNSSYFRFYGLFPVFISLISKKSQIRPIFTYYSFKWSVRLKHNSKEKILVWGQISNLGSFRVKFRTSPNVDKLYLKMNLLARTFHKNYS